ncbi:MAG: glycine/D-amino acid oxidase-like deaminating enzyme [Gammaproteobacteria bacterium]|jgi:glycine/D-amino acid oxidase-like deaminating enzyme
MKFTPLKDSLWYATASEAPDTRVLEEQFDSDVCIIGGGYTGLTTALELLKCGIRVTLLEAEEIGYGGSGRNAGHCTPTFTHHSPADIRKLLGEPRASRLIERQLNGANMANELIQRHNIDCEWHQTGYLRGALNPRSLPALESLANNYNAEGKSTQLLDRESAAKLTGSDRFFGAWYHPEGGHLNPLGYARGLAGAILKKRGAVFTHSHVQTISPSGSRWLVKTERGSVIADKVICGTGAYSTDIWPGLDKTFRLLRVFVAATQPMPEAVRQSVLPGNTTLSDGRGDLFVVKFDKDGRLVVSMIPLGRRGRDEQYTRRLMSDRLRWLFPQLGQIEWPYLWFGELDMQRHIIPRLYNIAPGVIAATGFSGRGVPTGTMIGGILADWVKGVPDKDLALELEPLTAAPLYMKFAPKIMISYYRHRDNLSSRVDGVQLPPHA